MKSQWKQVTFASALAFSIFAAGTAQADEVATGNVLVRYMDEYGNLLSGTATGSVDAVVTEAGILDENQVAIGTNYDTSEHKPATITTEAGKTWYLIDKEYYNGKVGVVNGVLDPGAQESGLVQAGTLHVTYVYSEKKQVEQPWIWPETPKEEKKTGPEVKEPSQPTPRVEPRLPEVPTTPTKQSKPLRLPAGNNGVKTRVSVNKSKKETTKKLRLPAGNNGAKTRVSVKRK